ncbi:ATP-binding protein [Thiohalobacter sp.]|uniref:ATP-binding protein n=1 Tax=Thiohalobacter sp. TaxID=2025948 RepID=UPI00261525ED|nr:ATP-binding protein [Thiohalobacter sp.]
MRSLQGRLLLAGGLLVLVFMGLTGLALDRAFRDSAAEAVRERLQAQAWGLLAALELDADGRLQMPVQLSDPRFGQLNSGLYAQLDADGEVLLWRSPSLLDERLASVPVAPGQSDFRRQSRPAAWVLALGIDWEYAPDRSRALVLRVGEDVRFQQAAVAGFRRTLLTWLGLATGVLLAAQLLLLRWGLRPLARVADELAEVRSGARARIGEDYPRELRLLTARINELIDQREQRLARSRDSLADLAHSLKTPLAVLRGAAQSATDLDSLRAAVEAEAGRINQSIEYQLQRAATAGRSALRPPRPLRPLLERLRDSLLKVHADRPLRCDIDCAEDLSYPAESGDLMELLGNLLDNACKWARGRVTVAARAVPDSGLELVVRDDGPGFPAGLADRLTERGVRGDEQVPGHGVGLAIVADIVAAYEGELSLGDAPGGGAEVRVRLPGGSG